MRTVLGLAAALAALAPAARAQDSGEAAGARIADLHCAACHATGRSGPSPLPDAPPFRELNRRGPLGELLTEGMIATPGPRDEEGAARRHPRMPQVMLDDAEAADLLAYLQSVQTPVRSRPPAT